MKSKLLLIAAVFSTFSALTALTACGGGSDDSSTPAASVFDAPALVKTDTVLGTGAEVTAGKTINVTYTLWLYDSTKADFKGRQIEGPATTTLSLTGVIQGWQQGIPGMKVGGKRTLVVPSSLGYGVNGQGSIPGKSGLVFDVQVNAVQ